MRVAFLVHQYLPEHIGGTEIYTSGLARRLLGTGHDVLVVSGDESPSPRVEDFVPRHWEHDGVPVVAIPYNLSVAPDVARYEYDNPHVAARVGEVLAAWKPDVVHVTHPMKLSAAAITVCQELGLPVVVSLCDFWFLCPRHTLLTWDERLCPGPVSWRQCLRCEQDLHDIGRRRRARRAVQERWDHLRGVLAGADHVLALSPFLARTFAANGFDASRIEVARHGIEPAGLMPPVPDGGPVRLTFVGSLVPAKGPLVAVDAVRARPDLRLRLTLHGAVRARDPYVEAIVAAAAADERITVAGEFPPEEMGRVLAATDFLVLPSLSYENEPIVVKQARHVGVPVIVSRLGSLVDMVEDDVDGWTVAPGDDNAWEDALSRAVAAHDSGRRWMARPQPLMDDHFSRVKTIYEGLARSGTTRPR